MEVNKIKKENNEKILNNETLLEEVQNTINELYLEEHKMYTRYNKNKKEFRKMKKIINIGCSSVFVCLTIPVFVQSIVAGLSVSVLCGGWLALSNKALNKMHKKDNENDKCTDLDQENISRKLFENEVLKNTIENSLFVRDVLNGILDNQRVTLSELRIVSTVFNDYDILHDFNKDEFNILNEYIKNYDVEEEFVKQSLKMQYSNNKEKVYQKTK